MALTKVQLQDYEGNIMHPETNSDVVKCADKTLTEELKTIKDNFNNIEIDGEFVYVSEEEPNKDGVWIDPSNSKPIVAEENMLVKQIKKYVDEKISGLDTGTGEGTNLPADGNIVYFGKEKPKGNGVWFDTSNDTLPVEENSIVKSIKDYIDSDINPKIKSLEDHYNKIVNPNLLDNGDFQINTLRSSEYNENGKRCLDKWELVNRDSENTQNVGKVILHDGYIEITDFGNKQLYIQQIIEDYELYKIKGNKITLSCDLKVNNMTQGGVFLQVGNNIKTEKIVFNKEQLNNQWQRKYITVDIPNNINNLGILLGNFYDTENGYIGMINCDCSLYVKNVKLELGDRATTFVSKSYEDEFNNSIPYRNTISNPNLVLNGDFRVNQRGNTKYEINGSAEYTVDRWISYNLKDDKTEITKLDKGINLKSNSGGTARLRQTLETDLTNSIKGKTLTFSIKVINDCSLVGITFTKSKNISDFTKVFKEVKNGDVLSVNLTVSADYENIGVQFSTNDTNGLSIEWAKLELASVATPFVPRNYGEELALCQRYFERVFFSTRLITDMSEISQGVEMNASYKVEKRIIPTMTIDNIISDVGSPSINTYTDNAKYHFCAFLQKDIDQNSKLSKGCRITWYGNADAEIY